MHHDPYIGNQLRMLRQDPTGRHNPLVTEFERDVWWLSFGGGALFGCVLALLFWLAI